MTSTYTSSQDPQEPEQTRPEIKIFRPVKRNVLKEPGIKNGHLILYQRPNFYVRTTNRRGRRPNPLRSRTGHTTLIPKVVPEQEKRIVASETRLMPQVEAINPVKQAFPILLTIATRRRSRTWRIALQVPIWLEAIIVTLGLLAGLVVHAFNVFYFPHYEL